MNYTKVTLDFATQADRLLRRGILAERDLHFQDALAAQLQDYDPEADTASQTSYLEALHTRLQATDLPIKLQAIPEKSPDLLGVVLKEGKV